MSTRAPWDFGPDPDVLAAPSLATAAPVDVPAAPSAWLTYEPFYGLTQQPFSLASNPAFFHQSRSHAATFQALLDGIRRRERLSVLTGDIGTGKTTLCRAVLQNLDRETFSAFVADPFASREDLLKVLLMEFGVMSLTDLTSGRLKTASRTELSYLLYDFLGKLAPLQAFAVVIIDEAQNLSLPLLEELRILSDFDGRDRQLQVVLVGQLELRQKLKLAEMRQVDQRVSVRCHLEPLSREDVAAYIAHRLRIAGGSPDRVSFSADACHAIFQASSGVPRVINRICDRALHHGQITRASVIDGTIARVAIREIEEPAAASSSAATDLDAALPPAAAPPGVATDLDATLPTADVPHPTRGDTFPHWLQDSPTSDAAATIDAPPPEVQPVQDPPRAPAAKPPINRRVHTSVRAHHRPRSPRARLAAAALIVIVVGGLAFGIPVLQGVWVETAEPAAYPNLPVAREPLRSTAFEAPQSPERVLPPLSPAGTCTIEVALFETRQAAAWLTEDLSAAGLRAYEEQLEFPNRGVQHVVAVGPYVACARAEYDLKRLREELGQPGARPRIN